VAEEEFLPWFLAGDPLVRHPRRATRGSPELQEALAAPLPSWELEEKLAGSIAVPILRGARLSALENLAGRELSVGDLSLLVPLGPALGPPPESPRDPLSWLQSSGWDGVLKVLERQVLLGWLDGPGLSVEVPGKLLTGISFDRLVAMPAGRLLLARAEKREDPAARAEGERILRHATVLALQEVAADSDKAQKEWRAKKEAEAALLGIKGDPVASLLLQADTLFSQDAGFDRSSGGALVAQSALRLRSQCPDSPCGGMDRLRALHTALRWEPALSPLVDAWEIIAWKDALDHLEVAWGRASAIFAQDGVVELLSGPELEIRILVMPVPGPASILALTRALGEESATSPESLFAAIRKRLKSLTERAVRDEPELGVWVKKIGGGLREGSKTTP
jgi:hypothetical protein